MPNEQTTAEKALQEKVDSLTTENKELKSQAKKDEAEIKKLKDADTKNSQDLADLKEKNSKVSEELQNSKEEFANYKEMHDQVVKETTDLTIQKRQEVQGLIQKRQVIKDEAVKFMKFLEDTLK